MNSYALIFVCVFLEINNSIKADEKVVMTYVSSYYHAFSTTQKVLFFFSTFSCFLLNEFEKKNKKRSIDLNFFLG